MCKPLRSLPAINARLDAVAELMDNLSAEADGFRSVLKKMPDLERQLARHHSLGSIHRR
jgi:DNA mismatch repair ATPase MutS